MPRHAVAHPALDAYDRLLRRRLIILVGLAALMAASLLFDLAMGPAGLPLSTAWAALTGADGVSPTVTVIVWQVRLPIALMALFVGAALSLAGAEMQTILDNPLASPFTLGVSAAASFGAAIAIVLGIGVPFLPPALLVTGNAFLFALGSVLLLQFLSSRSRGGPDSLVLFGIGLAFTFNALLTLVQFVASADALQQVVFWSMGSLARANWPSVAALAVVVAAVAPFALAASWRMTALRLGEERARSYGVNVRRLRAFSLLRISLLTATAMSFVGTIGFVGLVGPHIARMLIGEDHRFFLPASALTGAAVMSLASVASKSVVPGVLLPVGIVTSLIGLPVFFALIMRQRGRA
ncbi:FecCD family ABC transporter permease [Chelatococcus reniformis]|uniref:FecCD family ABC transporter permease n=1 Tax=Chelatococcus reniformis TaxID=1494448 RepID=UPI001FCE95B0|nr:iron ABC transporter permease [Chelatococcus reniformis]